MVTLADMLVPGLGPVVEVLKLICSAANEMHESQELCTRAYKKLAFIYEKLEAMQAKDTLPSDAVLAEYSELVGEYCAFLLKYRNKTWLYRVVTFKRVMAKVKEVQDTINDLMHALNMWHVEAMADERRLQEEFREQQVRFIEARLVDDATIAREVAHVPQQLEALSVFRHELQQSSLGSELDQRVVRTALDKVMRRSSAQVPSVPEWFLPSHKVEFEKQMFARGSFGTVHHGKMGAVDVVVKCLLVDTRENERVMATFRREADLWFKFRHPHVLAMFGACDVSSPPFIVCEYAVNSNLFNYLGSDRNRQFTFKLLREAAAGLAYLHEQQVVHGDLKCDNILVMGDGTAKIADFSFSYVRTLSMSKQSATDPRSTDASKSGALMWRAPECFKGRRPTTASDVYSFGMCIIEAVSGELPWGYHVDSITVRELVKSGRLPDQPEHMSDRAWTLVQNMCSFNPAKRPKMELVVRALGDLAADEAAAAAPSRVLISGAALSQVGPFVCSPSGRTTDGSSGQLAVPAVQRVEEEREILTDHIGETGSTPSESLSVSALTQVTSATQKQHLIATTKPVPTNTGAVDSNTDDSRPSISIHEAAKQGRTDIIVMWLRRGIDVDTFKSMYGTPIVDASVRCTALHIAAWFGQLEAARVLLENGADMNADVQEKSSLPFTALHCAAEGGHADIIKLLLQYEAVALDEGNDSPLLLAARNGHLDAVRVLLENGANVHTHTRFLCYRALHYAAFKGYADIARLLLQRGADMNAVDGHKSTPLHYAVKIWYPEVVSVLLESKADLSREGKAALRMAAERGHVGVVNALLARGVAVDRKSLKLAEQKKHHEVVRILEPRAPPSILRRLRRVITSANG